MPTEEQQPAPTPDFDKLWEEKYSKGFQDAARNNAYIVKGEGTAEDLFQDLYVDVWMKAVNRWPAYVQKSVAKGTQPNIDAWVSYLLKHYLIDRWRKTQTERSKFHREVMPLDAPVRSEEGEDATLGDFVGALDKALQNVDSDSEIDSLLNQIKDPAVRQTVEIIVANPGPPEEVWAKVRKDVGHSRSYMQQKLKNEPAILEFFKDHLRQKPPQALEGSDGETQKAAVASSVSNPIEKLFD